MLLIRNAEPSDLATIVRFNTAMALETEGLELDEMRLVHGVQALLADRGKGRYFVAEVEDTVVGQAMITREWSDWRNGYWWWVQSVYVLPEWRRKGVFRTLHEQIAAEARKAGDAVGLRLYVDSNNQVAQEAYAKLGMEASRYLLFESAEFGMRSQDRNQTSPHGQHGR